MSQTRDGGGETGMESLAFSNVALLFGAAFVVAGIATSLVASRFGAPLLFLFLCLGMLAGQDGPGGIVFNDYRVAYIVGSLALAVILFDGGLRTRSSSFRGVLAPALMLSTIGVVVTAGITGAVATLILDLRLVEGLLVGAIVASTDAAAVFFLMRSKGVQLRRRVANAIEIESATNDPVAVFLTLVLVELVLAPRATGWVEVSLILGQQALVGAAIGVTGGLALAATLNRVTLPQGLHPLLVVAAAVLIFALASVLQGSGFLAAYLAGLILGNRPVRAFPTILSFHDATTWLSQIVMFLVLGLLVTPSTLVAYALPAMALAVFLIVVGRPVSVWLCLTPFGFSRREKTFVSWVGLRGAVSIFLAAIPTLADLPNAETYFNVAFFVVLVSLLVQGWTVAWAAGRLGLKVRDTGPEIKRLEIDLPGQLELELVGYPVAPSSPVLAGAVFPSWMRTVMIVRGGEVLTPEAAGELAVGDYVYVLAPPARVGRLDRLFATLDGASAFGVGTFSFGGDAAIEDVCTLYGLHVPADLKGLTVAAGFAERFEDRVDIGDRIAIEPAYLLATAIRDDQVAKAVVEFEEDGREGAGGIVGRVGDKLRGFLVERRAARAAAGKAAPGRRPEAPAE